MIFILIFIFGLLLGSFLNVVIIRIPKEQSIAFPPSHCTSCNTTLKWYHNIPVFSWLFLRGKCAFCKSKISMIYPIIEILSAALFTIVFYTSGLSLSSFFLASMFLILLALSVIDFKYKMVPDSLNLLALVLALAASQSFSLLITNFKNALIFAGGFTLLRFALSYLLTSSARIKAKKRWTTWNKNYHTYPYVEALGEADIIVVSTIAAVLGVGLTLFAIFLSAVLALPVMLFFINKPVQDNKIPFIPFLATALLITYLFHLPIYHYLVGLYA